MCRPRSRPHDTPSAYQSHSLYAHYLISVFLFLFFTCNLRNGTAASFTCIINFVYEERSWNAHSPVIPKREAEARLQGSAKGETFFVELMGGVQELDGFENEGGEVASGRGRGTKVGVPIRHLFGHGLGVASKQFGS